MSERSNAPSEPPTPEDWAEIQKLVDDDCPMSIVANLGQNVCSWEEAADRIEKYAEAAWRVAKGETK